MIGRVVPGTVRLFFEGIEIDKEYWEPIETTLEWHEPKKIFHTPILPEQRMVPIHKGDFV